MTLLKFSNHLQLFSRQSLCRLRQWNKVSSFRHYASHLYTKNPYEILGVSPNTSRDQIKKQYYKLCQKYHPDINPSEEAKNKMAEINAAWEMVKDGTADRVLQMQREHQQHKEQQQQQQYGGYYTRDPSADERYRYYNRSNYYETNAKKRNVVYMEERIFQAPAGYGQVRVVIYRYDDGSTDQQIFYESTRDDSSKFTQKGFSSSSSQGFSGNMPPRPNPFNMMKILIRTFQIGFMLYFGFVILGIFLSMLIPREEQESMMERQQQQRHRW